MTKNFYYYYRNDKRKPIITVCVIIDVNKKVILSRGMAICHSKDNFCKKVGRELAYNRAKEAFCSKENILPIHLRNDLDNALGVMPLNDVIINAFDYKGCTTPKATEIEKYLLESVSKRHFSDEVIIYQEDDGGID